MRKNKTWHQYPVVCNEEFCNTLAKNSNSWPGKRKRVTADGKKSVAG